MVFWVDGPSGTELCLDSCLGHGGTMPGFLVVEMWDDASWEKWGKHTQLPGWDLGPQMVV